MPPTSAPIPDPTPEHARLSRLEALATRAAAHAYAPYSQFRVGCALLLTSGETVCGCNVEVASYRLTCCAEQAAVAAAVSQYGPAIRVEAAVVVNLNGAPCAPCGACRQTLAEFASPEASITFPTGPAGQTLTCTLAELLPSAFTQASLEVSR